MEALKRSFGISSASTTGDVIRRQANDFGTDASRRQTGNDVDDDRNGTKMKSKLVLNH
jgi:hypothetical protein